MKAQQAMDRFEASIEKDEDDCWLWKGKLRGGQPSQITIAGVRKTPRRLAFELHSDAPLPPSSYWLRASCGKCNCVNPKCLKAVKPNSTIDKCEREQIKEAIKSMKCEVFGREFHSLNDLALFYQRTLSVSVSTVYRIANEVNQCPKI
jgi:hypothetical protein